MPDLRHVLDVALQVDHSLLERGEVSLFTSFASTPPWYLSARIGHDDRGVGRRQADLRHLMSRNSAPRSAPNPASVTT